MATPTFIEPGSVFEVLDTENRRLAVNRVDFQLACQELANANGSGSGIRRRILRTLARISEARDGFSR
jgi:hypothetical protein